MAAQRATACVSIFNRLSTCGRLYPAGIPREAVAASFGGRVFDNRRLHSETQEKAEEVKEQVGGKADEVAGAAKGQASKNADTAKDMFQDFPQKVSDTAKGLKEVGVEAAKSVKRDASKIAEKTGLKTD